MYITQKRLANAKQGMKKRITELCALTTAGKIKQEYHRCFPDIDPTLGAGLSDVQCLCILLNDLVDLSIPQHMTGGV